MMDLHQRKINRLTEYDYSTNGAYFITICIQGRCKILSDIVGDGFPVPKPIGLLAERLIRQIPDKYPSVHVDNYVIMPDHIHLLLRIDNVGDGFPVPNGNQKNNTYCGRRNASPTIGNVVGWYKYSLTKAVNLQGGTSGMRLLQRSYYDHVIRNQQDYDEIWRYIENNPIKWVIEQRNRE